MLMKMRSQMQRTNNQKGFTLVELMVVVVIIGILVAIAVPVYNNVTAKAERSSLEANMKTIDGAIMAYYASTDSPTTLTATDITANGNLIPSFLAAPPDGLTGITYGITGTAPAQRCTAATSGTDTVGGHTFTTAVTLENLPWR